MISPTFTSFGTPSPAGMPSEQPLFVYVVFQWLAHTCPLSCSSGQGQRPPILPFEWLWIGDSPNQGQLLWHIIHHFVNPSNPSASWLLGFFCTTENNKRTLKKLPCMATSYGISYFVSRGNFRLRHQFVSPIWHSEKEIARARRHSPNSSGKKRNCPGF